MWNAAAGGLFLVIEATKGQEALLTSADTIDRQALSTAVCGILKRKLADNHTLDERIPVASHILVRETA